MYRLMLLGLVFGSGCGTSSLDDSTVESRQKKQVQAKINQLVAGIMQRDPALLREVLSPKLLEAARRQGPDLDATLASSFDAQRRGLIGNFGAEWLAENEIRVIDVVPTGNLVAVSVEFRGATSPKLVYFEPIDGDFRFSGVEPEGTPAQYSVTGLWLGWPHWWWGNDSFQNPATVWCGLQAETGVQIARFRQVQNFNCLTNDSCTWFGTRCTWTNNSVDSGLRYCAYQVFGIDGYIGGDQLWFCYKP